jgi:beta-barrel assembly-enhancing protease
MGFPRIPARGVERLLAVGAVAAVLFGWGTPSHALSEQEQRNRILFETRERETELAAQGFLYGDPALDAYLQSVMDRLYPEKHGEYEVRAVRDIDFNAFAVATGNVYVNVGALLRLHNEAELASVLGHEGGHLFGDHMYRGRREAKAVARLGFLLPIIGPLASYSTMAGFSRDFEREADRTGVQRLMAAGYDPKAAAPVFDRVAREVNDRKIKEPPYVFADHPPLLERSKNYAEFAANAAPGELREAEYLEATQAARVAALKLTHERREGAALIDLLDDASQVAQFAPGGEFFLAEGYRFRAAEGDEQRAIEHYDRSIEEHPDFAPAFGARGRIFNRRGDRERALADLERFVELAPDSREAPFAKQTIDRLKKDPPQ